MEISMLKERDKNTQLGDKIEEIEVTFRCKVGPIGEVGNFFRKSSFKIYYCAKSFIHNL